MNNLPINKVSSNWSSKSGRIAKFASTRKDFRLYQMIFFILILCLFFAGVWSLLFHSFDDDEFQHLQATFSIFSGRIPYIDFFEHHLMFYHILAAPFCFLKDWYAIFIFRSFSLFFAAISLSVLYRCAKMITIRGEGAFCAILLLGASPFFMLKMTEVRPEAPAILALSCALYQLFYTRDFVREKLFRSILFGLTLSSVVLFSQKYIIISLFILFLFCLYRGLRSGFLSLIFFISPFILYFAVFFCFGAAEELIRSVVIMNMNWKYKFSWTLYMSELFISSPALVVCGIFSILANFADRRKRTYSFGLLFLLVGAFLQIYLVPVPYRQSFLPLLLILTLGASSFFSDLLIFFARIKLKILKTVLPLLVLFSSVYSLIENLKSNNSKDINFYLSIANFRDDLSFFDGRALIFYRKPVSYYGWLHFELLQMLDHEDLTQKTIGALKNNFLPPIIYDYRVKLMPDDIQTFIADNYIASEIDELMLPGKIIKRILPASKTFFSIPFSGKWQISWNGSDSLDLNEEKISSGSVVFLQKGEHCISAGNFAWDCKICACLKKE